MNILNIIQTAKRLAIVAMVLLLPSACEDLGQIDANEEFEPIVLTKSQQAVAARDQAFAFDFLKETAVNFPGENLFVSPMSVAMLSYMLANGAEGETYAEIVKAIGLDNFTTDQVNDYYSTMVSALLKADASVKLSLANSIWAAHGLEVRKAFENEMKKVYKADTYVVDFWQQSTLKQLNDWCSGKTNGLIPKMFEEIDPMIQMILINALYFKGNWKVQFAKDYTAKGPFTTRTGQQAEVDFMMATSDVFTGYQDGEVTVVRMPYGNGAFLMEAVMPSGKDFDAFLASLTPDRLARWDATTTRTITLTYPKFKADFDTDDQLVPIMRGLGVRRAFTDAAEFGPMSPAPLYVSDMRQKAFVSIDEEGTEAAAVTIAEMRKNGSVDEQITMMTFDRPFLYLIREKSTGAILFMGTKVK